MGMLVAFSQWTPAKSPPDPGAPPGCAGHPYPHHPPLGFGSPPPPPYLTQTRVWGQHRPPSPQHQASKKRGELRAKCTGSALDTHKQGGGPKRTAPRRGGVCCAGHPGQRVVVSSPWVHLALIQGFLSSGWSFLQAGPVRMRSRLGGGGLITNVGAWRSDAPPALPIVVRPGVFGCSCARFGLGGAWWWGAAIFDWSMSTRHWWRRPRPLHRPPHRGWQRHTKQRCRWGPGG